MSESATRSDEEFIFIYERHVKTIWHVCYGYMKNIEDTKDVVQETFLKLYQYQGIFSNELHEKSWLIVTASNQCKNILKHWWRKRKNIDNYSNDMKAPPIETDTTLEVVLELPEKYKLVVYLYYYEGYNSAEIAEILHKPKSTIRNYLSKARNILKTKLGGDFDEKQKNN